MRRSLSLSSFSIFSSSAAAFLVLLLCLDASTTFLVVVKAEEQPVSSSTDEKEDGASTNRTSIEGCPCIDVSFMLGREKPRKCILPITDVVGVKLSLEGSCVPLSYGSSRCLQHDLIHDPSCSLDNITETPVASYCFRPWCYVDSKACMKNSYEQIYRSNYFSFDTEIDLFYSYSTCNSTADDWLETTNVASDNILKEVSIIANVPTYVSPMMYKIDPFSKEKITDIGDEYYDDSFSYGGVYINYVNKLTQVSNGDIKNLTLTYRSKSSSLVHPTSSFTAAVQDVSDGLVDMSVGPFWITGERLKLTAFTIPILYDKTFLVIPRPGSSNKLRDQVIKVAAPFEPALWVLLLFVILVAALLSVWFTDQSEVTDTIPSDKRETLERLKNPLQNKRIKKVYARLALDAFLEKGTNFVSAGVDNDASASLPTKFLAIGFGFFILITVSAYVANLAAFLTRNMSQVKSMESAVSSGWIICAHPVLESEFKTAWPDAKFYFTQTGNEFHGVLEDYSLKRCDAMAIGWEDTSMDEKFMEQICEMDLVITDSLIIEIAVAFPIRPELASGFSYWINQSRKLSDLSINNEKEAYMKESGWKTCNFRITEVQNESDDYAKITVRMMFLPLVMFLSCSILGVMMQVYDHRQRKRGHQSLVGRASSIDRINFKPKGKQAALFTTTGSLKSSTPRILRFRSTKRKPSSLDEEDEDEYLSQTIDLEKSAKEYGSSFSVSKNENRKIPNSRKKRKDSSGRFGV